MKLNTQFTSYTKKKNNKKPLEGNTAINLHDLALGNEFLDKICKAQMAKKKKNQIN